MDSHRATAVSMHFSLFLSGPPEFVFLDFCSETFCFFCVLFVCLFVFWLESDLCLVPVLCSAKPLFGLRPVQTWCDHNAAGTETKVLMFE